MTNDFIEKIKSIESNWDVEGFGEGFNLKIIAAKIKIEGEHLVIINGATTVRLLIDDRITNIELGENGDYKLTIGKNEIKLTESIF